MRRVDDAAVRRAAFDFLPSLKIGDRLTITQDGRTNVYRVTREAHLSDGAYGSWESTRVTVQIRPGGYAFELTAEQLGGKWTSPTIARLATADEIVAADAREIARQESTP